jgi:hypothetical protein
MKEVQQGKRSLLREGAPVIGQMTGQATQQGRTNDGIRHKRLEADNRRSKGFSTRGRWWSPLAEYACEIAPDITGKCRHWHYNEGDGLNAEDSQALADRLQAELDSGRADLYAKIFATKQAMAPKEPCGACEGTGTNGGKFCWRCGGSGYVEPLIAYCGFDTEFVRKFVRFLRGCGGFSIT